MKPAIQLYYSGRGHPRPLAGFGFAYLHIIEPRVKGNMLIAEGHAPVSAEQLRKIFKGNIIAAGGLGRSSTPRPWPGRTRRIRSAASDFPVSRTLTLARRE